MNLRRYRDFLLVVLALAVPFGFLRASMRDPKQATGADRFLIQLATPIQYAAATLARGVSRLFGDYVYLVDVKARNAELSGPVVRRIVRHVLPLRSGAPAPAAWTPSTS